jgi:hypothetical protein
MARLRTRAFQIKRGHVARIDVLRDHTKDLPTKAKIRISRELQSRFKALKLDERIERLQKLVSENEHVVRDLTRQAQAHLAANEFQKLSEVLAGGGENAAAVFEGVRSHRAHGEEAACHRNAGCQAGERGEPCVNYSPNARLEDRLHPR